MTLPGVNVSFEYYARKNDGGREVLTARTRDDADGNVESLTRARNKDVPAMAEGESAGFVKLAGR